MFRGPPIVKMDIDARPRPPPVESRQRTATFGSSPPTEGRGAMPSTTPDEPRTPAVNTTRPACATRPTPESATTHTRQLFQALAIGGVGPVALGVWPCAVAAVTRRR